ncbi:MAG: ComF family protein [Desulfurivibrionaceae bacterium]|nr:ComF family protein [Desulfobulbales bacterium]MDT8334915.1 ComF family protein [Desulfurivibrionaceae bacterium]
MANSPKAHGPMRKLGHEIAASLLELFLPASCLACGQPPVREERAVMLCRGCRNEIEPITEPLCTCCGQQFRNSGGGNHLCGLCLSDHYHFTMARALLRYTPPITKVISRFKYHGRTAALKTFRTLHEQIPVPGLIDRPDLIIPVPLHRKRLRERGFNQALLLARAFYPDHGSLIDFAVLERQRYTAPQTSLSGKARRQNLKKAFRVKNSEVVAGKRVLLIDDVFTTGTTVNECAAVLKKAGAKEVAVLTLARVD